MALEFFVRKPDSGLGNIRSSPADPYRNIDWVLMFTQGLLTVIGCFVVYSASWTRIDDDPYAFVTRQVVFAIAAGVGMVIVMSLDYQFFKERAALLYSITIALLMLLLVMAFVMPSQSEISFDLGPLNFQPAELAKFTTLIALAAYLADERSDEVSYPRFLGGLILVGTPATLIILQPDLGSASVIISIAMGVLLVAGAKPRYIALISFLSVMTVAGAFVGGFVNEYQKERFRVFFGQNTDENSIYQVRNAIRALGTGGVFGKGWLEGQLTNDGSVPVMWADFPFAAVGEQFGLAGCAVLLFLFMVMLARIWRIATLSKDLLGTYLCAGVFTMLLWQVFQNVGMTLGIMPVTGLPMPFISYGGSSLLSYFAMMGIVQSVHMRRMR
ncbi:rod shape determining protein RodA [Ilumatobacter fluminis]|uniref:peptidoglycan glycosyltransferase n=1 Tax=Ilumatobacter fluminis TaxID=467091 RepID=A0A4R7HY23_9ACTN|nr:FtsW/RodA/SpoVE family cell cycle protein [Ilumatobacter fluminis]TDT15991.1 rod shape determining protein RodA [Ilumatobacter fluminis]